MFERHRPLAPSRIAAGTLLLLVACACVGALAGNARAATPAQPPSSAIAQYVEMIPTGTGGQAVGVGVARTAKLPPRIAKKITAHGGAAASTLERVATSSAYGAPAVTPTPVTPAPVTATPRPKPSPTPAPARRPSPTPEPSAPNNDPPVPPASLAHALSIAFPASMSGGFASVWIGLVVVTAAAFVAARRARRPS